MVVVVSGGGIGDGGGGFLCPGISQEMYPSVPHPGSAKFTLPRSDFTDYDVSDTGMASHIGICYARPRREGGNKRCFDPSVRLSVRPSRT